MSDRDDRCGCRIVRVAANRRDRRRNARLGRGAVTPNVQVHRMGCPIGDTERSDTKTRTQKEVS